MCDHDHSREKDQDKELREAANSGNYECLTRLIKAGADVNSRSKFRKTACMLAAQSGHERCLEALLEAGADVNALGMYGKTTLMLAVETGQAKCVNMLLKAGADVNDCDTVGSIRGKTVLMHAAEKGDVNCLNMLLKAGADVNQKSKLELTALMFAIRFGQNTCVKSLIQAGADVNLTDNNGSTALILLCQDTESISTLQLLLKSGAHVNKINSYGTNALKYHLALFPSPNKTMVMTLFAAGERIDGTTVTAGRLIFRGHVIHQEIPVPEYLLNNDLKFCLKHICREAIRKHLIDLKPHEHLFGRIPRLGLPILMTEYLLYNTSLDD